MDPSECAAVRAEDDSNPKKRILVVDDEAGIRKVLCGTLKSEGHDCLGCDSGIIALELISTESFDAVISDLRMPDLDGLELLRLVRKVRPHLAFIMATGVDDARYGVEAMKEGADDYLVKPLNLDVLVKSLDYSVDRKRLELELENHRDNLEKIVDERTQQLQAALRRVKLTSDETLRALAAAVDLRDDGTGGHSRRVMAYCLEIAKAMGCDDEQMNIITRGALLHDIGKIGIPDSIVLKPGPLTDTERSVMQTHVKIGHDLLKRISFLEGAAEIVLTHHERFDGTGYPRGLAGLEIPLGARIFAVADTLDAITSDRHYRRAKSYGAAREEISRVSGSQLDPLVVSVFLSISEATWERIHQEEEGAQTSGSVGNTALTYAALAQDGMNCLAATAASTSS